MKDKTVWVEDGESAIEFRMKGDNIEWNSTADYYIGGEFTRPEIESLRKFLAQVDNG